MTREVPVREVFVDGIAMWTPALPGWARAAAALRGEPAPADATPARPAPAGLAANERRRAPDSVLVALQVAEEAVAMSGHVPAALASIFTSAHGDLPIIDALCRTLAAEPQLLSPTRFHHSVHNAPSGYWAIASGCHAASTALTAYDQSFGAGLLEALVQLATEGRPLLLAGCDTQARGPLASVNTSRGVLGAALVLAPRPGSQTCFAMRWSTAAATSSPASPHDEVSCTSTLSSVAAMQANALADALPLFATLACARREQTAVELRCGPGLKLQLWLQPFTDAG